MPSSPQSISCSLEGYELVSGEETQYLSARAGWYDPRLVTRMATTVIFQVFGAGIEVDPPPDHAKFSLTAQLETIAFPP